MELRLSARFKAAAIGDSGTAPVLHFTLDSDTGKVRIMKGRTMFGGIVFDTTKVGPGATASLNAGLPRSEKRPFRFRDSH